MVHWEERVLMQNIYIHYCCNISIVGLSLERDIKLSVKSNSESIKQSSVHDQCRDVYSYLRYKQE